MKKRYLFIITGLGILLLCGVMTGNSILRKVNRHKEMMRMMEEQKIVFICTEAQFSDNFQLVGYFIDYRGDWEGYNSDEYAQRIVEIIGKDTWMESIFHLLGQ